MTSPGALPWDLDCSPSNPALQSEPPLMTADSERLTPVVPSVPVTSSTAAPAGPTDWATQFQAAIQDAAQSALHAAAPAIQDQVAAYAQQYITGVLTGQPVNPTVTATTVTGKDLTIASAKNRSWRTFLAGMGLDVVFALVAVIGTLGNIDFFSKAGWITFVVLVTKTVIQSIVAYVARIKVAPPYEKS